MVSTTLDKGKISGVGPKLKQRLIASGIRTANDVSYSRVLQVSGFGEAKARSVVNWSIDVERELKRTQPTKISLDKEEYISNKYQRARNAVIQEEQDEYEAIAVDLKSIQENAKIRHTENDENEMLAREKKEQLENQKAGKIKNLEPYSPLTYFNFIKYSLGLKAMPRELRGRIILLTIPGIILIGFLCQGLTLAGSIGAMLVDAIPTYTPTASLTPTVTLSPTPTNTLTYTITVTPSITPTYTITLTPSDTPTPTITYTPTITFTPTLTPTPTATIPSFSNINCIPQNTKREAALVTRIIDGDTIEVKIGEEIYPLRYIGIDTPEQGENFAVYAANRNGELVSWKWVTLVKDESETDRYDRLLRYVFFGDIFVNYQLVKEGFAHATNYPPDESCQYEFRNAENDARSSKVGIWKPTPAPQPTSPPVVVPPSSSGTDDGNTNNNSNCHPSYPDVCIPIGAADYDCAGGSGNGPNYINGPITVLHNVPNPDPHRLDGDKDGRGCE